MATVQIRFTLINVCGHTKRRHCIHIILLGIVTILTYYNIIPRTATYASSLDRPLTYEVRILQTRAVLERIGYGYTVTSC